MGERTTETTDEHQTKHKSLLAICPRLQTDYTDYGGAVERWADDDQAYPDCSSGCRWAEWLRDPLGADWCVCTNPKSPRVGLLTFEHMAGYGCFEEEKFPKMSGNDPERFKQLAEWIVALNEFDAPVEPDESATASTMDTYELAARLHRRLQSIRELSRKILEKP